MSDAVKILIACAGYVVIAALYVLVSLRTGGREARKAVERMDPPDGVELGEAGAAWLGTQLARRNRWMAIGTAVAFCIIAPVGIAGDDIALLDETMPVVQFPVSMVLGYGIAGALAYTRCVRAVPDAHRIASLSQRDLSTYTRGWERALQNLHLALALSLVLVGLGWLRRGGPAASFLLLGVGWAVALTLIRVLQSRTIRTPPLSADDELYVARELMISLAVRSLLGMQLLVVSLVSFVALTYLWLTVDGFPWGLSMIPLYGCGAIGAGIALARTIRRDRGLPAPEWQFARAGHGSLA